MKLHYLLVPVILTAMACKKDGKVTPAPTPPTKDYREKYTGVFTVTSIHWSITNPSGGPRTQSKQGYTGTLQVTYNMSDSIDNLSKLVKGGNAFRQPALTFTYGSGTSQLVGVDTTGKLHMHPKPNGGDYGGFVTVDSIFHASAERHTTSSSEDTLYGKRVK